MRIVCLGLSICFMVLGSYGQKRVVGAVGFYNVENLFDTSDAEGKRDGEYTPDGENEWDQDKYESKLDNLAKVISTMAKGPDILGLSEVENLRVISDLVSHQKLRSFGYQIVHQESPDRRGIDCALIYKADRFKLLNYKTYKFPSEDYVTRDVLHVNGLYFGDSLHVLVNHWPSRYGGQADKRNRAAELVRNKVDSLLNINPKSKIIIMGDFNDDPINKSIKKILRARKKRKLKPGDLFNTSAKTFSNGYGTLYYRGVWNLFDQVIVSQGLLNDDEGIVYTPNSFSIFGPEWMRVKSGQYATAPKRTLVRGVYHGGYSDHFPSYILISK